MQSRYIGVVLIAVGVALAIWGYNIYNSAEAQFTQALNGDVPMNAWIGMVGGAISIAFGVMRVK